MSNTTRLVDEALLERVAADPEWASRVLIAAAHALNAMLTPARPDGFTRPGSEWMGAREILMHAFINWDEVLLALQPATEVTQ